jgi:type II secretory pathway component GspD/PulD (secretin)
MEWTMKSIIAACAAAGLAAVLLGGVSSAADSTSSEAASESSDAGIPIERIIATVAHKTGKKYLIDPRVRAHVQLIGQDPSNITYSDLLTILQMHGFVAVEGGGYVRVLPDANARQVAEPQMSSGQTFPDAQIVNYIIPVKNGPAAFLVPILRPMLPQYAHLAAAVCSNSLLVVDSYANVRRIETMVKILDVGAPYKPEKCEMPNPATHHE